MKRFLTALTIIIACISSSYGQQEAQYTKYMFNSLVYNPAYAGSSDFMNIGLLHRSQWFTHIEGAPISQTFTLHTPLNNNKVGVGGALLHDKIGPTRTVGITLDYAYRIPVGLTGKLAFGLQGSIANWSADWKKLLINEPNDPAFNYTPNSWLPNFGVGIYYYTRKFYAGLSCPNLLEHDLRTDKVNTALYARQSRHYYFTIGGAIPLRGNALMLKPSMLIKNVGIDSKFKSDEEFKKIGAPTSVDMDLALLFNETFWIGTAYRTAIETITNSGSTSVDSWDIWTSIFLKNGMRVGLAYDYPLSKLNEVTAGSFEVMLGYEFNFKSKRIVTPRYF
jgi:type IX secretion system PorP/SprF family membrane protein